MTWGGGDMPRTKNLKELQRRLLALASVEARRPEEPHPEVGDLRLGGVGIVIGAAVHEAMR